MPSLPPRVLVAGSSDAERGVRADRLARFFRVPHICVGEVLLDHAVLGAGDVPVLRVIAARLGDSPGYVIDSAPRTLAEAAAVDGLPASLTVPADLEAARRLSAASRCLAPLLPPRRAAGQALVVHLRSDEPATDSVVGCYQARGTLAEFLPDTDDETIVDRVERAVLDRIARAVLP